MVVRWPSAFISFRKARVAGDVELPSSEGQRQTFNAMVTCDILGYIYLISVSLLSLASIQVSVNTTSTSVSVKTTSIIH